MACSSATLKGLANDCLGSIGGIKEVRLAPWADLVAGSSITIDESGEVTALDYQTNFKVYYTKKNSSSMTSTYNIDVANGVNYVSTELNLVFSRMNAEKRMEVSVLATNDLLAIVTDSNGESWILGLEEPLILTAGTAQTGTAKGDGNNYNLTFTDESMQLPKHIKAGVIQPAG